MKIAFLPMFLLIPFLLICFALAPQARATCQEGCLANSNTVLGDDALFSLTTGADNTAIGLHALYSNTDGNSNTATGWQALFSNTTGNSNTANGVNALLSNTTGHENMAIGFYALSSNTTGNFNTASGGRSALGSNTTGSKNTAEGQNALSSNTTGSGNIGLGYNAGANLTTGNNNIDIFAQGIAGEANTIRIGRQGTQTATFIAGISGTTVAGMAVVVNTSGQLGVAASSRRFKQNIQAMGDKSDLLLALRPVTFEYKPALDPKGVPQFGLVAEDVEKVNPDLVARDEQGKPYTVRYEAVNAMLLNEFLKEHRAFVEEQHKVQELKSAAANQEATIAELKSAIAQQQKGLEVLTAGLQKVSTQLEVRKATRQTVVNNQ